MAKKKEKKTTPEPNTETGEGIEFVETAKTDRFVISQLTEAVKDLPDGMYKAKTDIGDLIIKINTGDTGKRRKFFCLVGDKLNTSVAILREKFKASSAPPKKKKSKKKESEEMLTEATLEKEYKAKKAAKAVNSSDQISKKKAKKIIGQWGTAKKISGHTIERTIRSILPEISSHEIVVIFSNI